jgi:predicted kinase
VSNATEADLRSRLLAGEPLDLRAIQPLLQRSYPELAALADVPADPVEVRDSESALDHTQRVLQQVRPYLQKLPADRARALYLAALLHEVGRGLAVGPAAARHGHQEASAARARDVLFRLRVSPSLRDHIVQLVRWHTMPLLFGRWVVRPARMLRLAWTLDTGLLYLLALADCQAGERPATCCRAVAAFRERCEQLGILGREPPPLLSGERWERLAPSHPRLRRRVAGELRYRRLKGTLNTAEEAEAWLRAQQPALAAALYLLVGVPASGKTTWVLRHLRQARVVSMDEMRERLLGDRADQSRNPEIYVRSRAILARALRAGETVVWDAQSHTYAARWGLLSLAREAHAYVIIVYLDVPLSVALQRNLRRPAAVPESVILRSYHDLEEPRPFEAEEVWRVDVEGRCTRYVWDEAAGA